MNTHRTQSSIVPSTALVIALLWIIVMMCRYGVWMMW